MILLVIACDTCPARLVECPVEAEDGEPEVKAWAECRASRAGWVRLNHGQWRCRECHRIAATASLTAPAPIHTPGKKLPRAWPARLVVGSDSSSL